MPRPVQVYSFADFSAREPREPLPGDRLDAQFRAHADAIAELHRVIDELKDRLARAEAPAARETLPVNSYPGVGGPWATDTLGAEATAADWAQVSIDWAEHLPDTIPGNSLAVTGVSGDHWSSRWWANRSANAFGMLAWWYQGAWPTPGPPSTPNTSTGQPLPVGAMYYNTTSSQMFVWNGTVWATSTAAPGASTGSTLYYTATAGQTVFPLSTPDRNGKTFAFNQSVPEGLAAHVNGLRLEAGFDFTINTVTSTVTFGTGVPVGQQVIFDIFTAVPPGNVAVSLSAPASPANGALWFNLVSGQLFVWANDGNSFQWVVAVNQNIAGLYLALSGGTLTGPLAGTSASFSGAVSASAFTGAAVGVTNNSNAAAGQVGEYQTASLAQGSPVVMSNGTARNIVTLPLTAGDWDISGVGQYVVTSGSPASVSLLSACSVVSGSFGSAGYASSSMLPAAVGSMATPMLRISAATSTTVYLVGQANFTGGAISGWGSIFARRVR